MAFVETDNLTFAYNGANNFAVNGVSLSVQKGQFVLLCGKSGCGKTTLLRLLKPELTPSGTQSGSATLDGVAIDAMSMRDSASRVGMVMQDVDSQLVTDKVWHELAFGLENLGYPTATIRSKIAEICGFLGIADLFDKTTAELSGGQKQLVNLASVLVTQPQLLLLDEPTAQLDPLAATDFLAKLKRVNQELGTTVIIVEHRLEEIFPIADKVAVMDQGKLVLFDTPPNLANCKSQLPVGFFDCLPTATKLFCQTDGKGACPLTVKQCKNYVTQNFLPNATPISDNVDTANTNVALRVDKGFFRYSREGADVIKNLSLSVKQGETLAVFGANGSGKTTLFKVLAGLGKLYSGVYTLFGQKVTPKTQVCGCGKVALLPQNPRDLFVEMTVGDDLQRFVNVVCNGSDTEQAVNQVVTLTGIQSLLSQHPYDLSGGEIQRAAIAKLMLTNAQILLLDEPTKGLDFHSKMQIAKLLATLKSQGKTIVIVTHDVEFSATVADRCALFFDGQIASVSSKRSFLSSNVCYTTSARKITRDTLVNAVTVDEAVPLLLASQGGTNDI